MKSLFIEVRFSDRSRYHVFIETETLSKHMFSRNNGMQFYNLGKKYYFLLNFAILTKKKIRLNLKTFLHEFHFWGC